jgi:WD40 repeat protein
MLTMAEIARIEGHGHKVESVALSLDGTRLATGSTDSTARLWDISGIPEGDIFKIACAWLPDHVSDQATRETITRLARALGTDLAWHGRTRPAVRRLTVAVLGSPGHP